MVRRLHPGATTLRAAREEVKIYAPSQLAAMSQKGSLARARMHPVPVVAEPNDELPAGLAHSTGATALAWLRDSATAMPECRFARHAAPRCRALRS